MSKKVKRKKVPVKLAVNVEVDCGICGKKFKLEQKWDKLGRKPLKVPNVIYVSGECVCGFDISYSFELDSFGYF